MSRELKIMNWLFLVLYLITLSPVTGCAGETPAIRVGEVEGSLVNPVLNLRVIEMSKYGLVRSVNGLAYLLRSGEDGYIEIKLKESIYPNDILNLKKESSIDIVLDGGESLVLRTFDREEWYTFHVPE